MIAVSHREPDLVMPPIESDQGDALGIRDGSPYFETPSHAGRSLIELLSVDQIQDGRHLVFH
ncbi:hypothetical protein OAE61_01440 [Verrucomicrobiales bacterium]|nr:hypothetical protein [bacterium]MDB4657163.1 hypothetical protein [Verrucomicrobiales bacterium]MDB4662277.1 hypothetical protein [Verrucomicrobiales bacterium]